MNGGHWDHLNICVRQENKDTHWGREQAGRGRCCSQNNLEPWLERSIEILLSTLPFLCRHSAAITSAALQRVQSQFIPMPNIYHTGQNKRWEKELYVQNSFSWLIKNRKSHSIILEGMWVASGRWLSSQVGEKFGEVVRRKKGDSPFSSGQ